MMQSGQVARIACWALVMAVTLWAGGIVQLARGETPGNTGDVSAPRPGETREERGYRLLTTKAYLPADFDQETFDELWKLWEEPLRSQAEKATPAERRKLAFERYGLIEVPGRESGVPLQYVDDGHGGWVMNCLACHGGKVAGKAYPGLPNSLYALQTLTEEVRATKLRLKKPLAHMDKGGLAIPLGTTHGTTNAVMFGKLLLAYRQPDLTFDPQRPLPKLVHHDHDAPPWWHMRKKEFLYIDGFAAKGHRALMQFLLIPRNGPEQFQNWEADYADILCWMESLEAPAYPWEIDQPLAARGQQHFNRVCAECHGTYGKEESYPERMVPLDVVGTDRVRWEALSVEGRKVYQKTWFNDFGEKPCIVDPEGYVAPPLDGIWATAPYLHNGSVPTLWHLLHVSDRPVIWKRSVDGYDQGKVGLEVTSFEKMPKESKGRVTRRGYFDTRDFGKSAAGHDFPEQLDEDEKRALLEYLKTL